MERGMKEELEREEKEGEGKGILPVEEGRTGSADWNALKLGVLGTQLIPCVSVRVRELEGLLQLYKQDRAWGHIF